MKNNNNEKIEVDLKKVLEFILYQQVLKGKLTEHESKDLVNTVCDSIIKVKNNEITQNESVNLTKALCKNIIHNKKENRSKKIIQPMYNIIPTKNKNTLA